MSIKRFKKIIKDLDDVNDSYEDIYNIIIGKVKEEDLKLTLLEFFEKVYKEYYP